MNESFIKISRMCVKSQADPGLELEKALTLRVRYVFCTMPNDGPARALLARNIQLAFALFCFTLYIYIVHVCTDVNY